MKLRPNKSCDAEIIAERIKEKEVFQKQGGERFEKALIKKYAGRGN